MKESLKISKRKSEAVHLIRTNNTMTQKDKQWSTKSYTENIEQQELHKNGGKCRCSRRKSRPCCTGGTSCFQAVKIPLISNKKERRARLLLRQTGYISGSLLHIYSIMVSQVMMTTAILSKWWL